MNDDRMLRCPGFYDDVANWIHTDESYYLVFMYHARSKHLFIQQIKDYYALFR
ncbi:14446_t:CDS:2 [Funneliformis caledonium]|uniref:14446_t:CDS:1 n=1 Tax=Funneliformis caledonium TaxID=1117310 RepID=A0A9N8VC89_9GLOM|nr:14446_t:CDS:2 [Funneliformis caledonium]